MLYVYNVENLKVLKCLPVKDDNNVEFEITGKCEYTNNSKDNTFRINISPVDANMLKNQINKHIDNESQDETNDQSDDQLDEIIDRISYIDVNQFTSFATESDGCIIISCGFSPKPIRIDKDFLINLVQEMGIENDK